MVDIVYAVGKGSKDTDDMPLRWSLRSVQMFAKNVGKVIVAGYPPDWLSSEVVKVPFEQTHRKHVNMLLTIAEAAKQANLDQPFLFSADDHYFCKEVDLAKWPRYCCGDLPSLKSWKKKHRGKKDQKPNGYSMNLFQTRFILKEEGLPARRYCLHVDTWTDPHDIERAVAISLKNEKRCKLGIEPQCILGALYEKRLADIGIQVKHIQYKLDSKVKTAAQCSSMLSSSRQCFSSSADAEKDQEFISWMDNFFCQKSKYEK